MKACTKCGKLKPETDFYVTRRDLTTREPITRKRQCKVCMKRKARTWLENRGSSPVDREKGTMLPIGPFREWLLERLNAFDGSRTDLALDLGVTDRRLYTWLKVADRVHIDYVDRVLLRCDCLLWEVYPGLYEFGEEAQAA